MTNGWVFKLDPSSFLPPDPNACVIFPSFKVFEVVVPFGTIVVVPLEPVAGLRPLKYHQNGSTSGSSVTRGTAVGTRVVLFCGFVGFCDGPGFSSFFTLLL